MAAHCSVIHIDGLEYTVHIRMQALPDEIIAESGPCGKASLH